ncbi:hypothetical protein [Paracoccus jiaweipingae]|uniref:hypothetical protein n=1 Tax=unclassified Paracoccus (in: a-proteobacteria) TaxID=2688777 RepID=UPI0037AB2ABC
MNLNQIFAMFQRMVLHRLMNAGINKGIDMMARRGGGQDADGKLTEQGRRTERQARDMTKRVRQANRILRRMK